MIDVPGFVFALMPVTGQLDLPLDLGTREGKFFQCKVTEEFIENFYDKYYSDTQNLSKDAFIMRLNRS